ncbi:MAG: TetR/AcrR family transcriptional regulator [Thermodesulfobacteriota bacterium]
MAGASRIETRKAQILSAAERVFARKGFAEATISDVAREARISEATIYEYFSSKEELLFSIPGDTTRRGNEILAFHLNYMRGAANKLRGIVYHYLWFYQHHPDYAAVAMLILKPNRKFIETEAYQAVREGFRLILDVIKAGMAAGEFRDDLDPYLVRAVILGTIEHLVIRRLLLGQPDDLLSAVDHLADLIISGIRREDAARTINLRVTVDGPLPAGAVVPTKDRPPEGKRK